MNKIEQIFASLEIEPTKEQRIIKKAYAKKVKQYHPEECPEEWKRIHDAYEEALNYAKGNADAIILIDRNKDSNEELLKEENQEHEENIINPIEEQSETRKEQREKNCEEIKQNSELNQSEQLNNEELPLADEKNSIEYNDLFQKVQEKEKKKSSTEIVKTNFNRMQSFGTDVPDEKWSTFLKSAAFMEACREEEFLLFLNYAITKTKWEPSILRLLQEVMEEIRTSLEAEMLLAHANIVKQIIIQCKSFTGYNVVEKMKKGKEKEQTKKKVVFWPILISIAVIFGVVMIAVKLIYWDDRTTVSKKIPVKITEEEAKREAVQYLNEKYTDSSYEVEDVFLSEYKGYSYSSDGDDLLTDRVLGYEGRVYDSYNTQIIIIVGMNETSMKEEVKCFDSRQETEIVNDLKAEIGERIGIEKGQAYLNRDSDNFISSFIKDSSYHTYYSGDLQTFFEAEANYRNNITIKTNERNLSHMKDLNKGNTNGRCVIYLSDPEILTILQRIEGTNGTYTDVLGEILQEMAKSYQIQMIGAVLPANLYENLFTNNQENMSQEIYDWLKMGGNITTGQSVIPPLLSPLMTSWYVSKSYDSYDNGYYSAGGTTPAVKIVDGMYAFEKYTRAKETKSQQDKEAVGQLQVVEMPKGLKQYLVDEKIAFQDELSFQLVSNSIFEQSYILTLNKEIFHIPESGYDIILTIPETKYSEEEHKILEVKSYSEVNTKAIMSTVCEGEGYLFLDYTQYDNEEAPIIVTILNRPKIIESITTVSTK